MSNEINSNVGFDLSALDVLLDSIAADTGKLGVSRDQFYGSMHRKLIASTASTASTVWVAHKNGQLRSAGNLADGTGWGQLSAAGKKEIHQLVKQYLKREPKDVSGSNEATQVSKLSCGNAYLNSRVTRNGLRFIYLLLRSKDDNELVEQVFADLVAELVSQIEIFENAQTASSPNKSARDLSHVAQLMQNLGKSGSKKELSFHLVNDVAKICGADRVSYLDSTGKIQAISGAAQISFRTAIVRNLARLGKTVLATKHPLEWCQDQISFDGKHLPRNVKARIEAVESPVGYAIPCQAEGRSSGILLLEYFSDQQQSLEQRELINEVVSFASPVIRRCTQVHSIPAIGLLDTFFNRFFTSPIRLLVWCIALGGLAWLAIYALFLVPRPFEIYGEGTLLPVHQQHVFAQIDGEVDQLAIAENSSVDAQQKLLVIESQDLEKDLITVEGEIAETQQQLRNLQLTESEAEGEDAVAEETQKAAEMERLKIRLAALDARLKFYEQQQAKQTVFAPLAGTVTTQNLRQRLVGRPINRGDLLMSIAQTEGPWQIELKIPDNRIEFVTEAMRRNDQQPVSVSFRLKSDSTTSYQGQLIDLDYRSDLRDGEDRTSVIATVSVDEQELKDSLRLGARVYGKVDCGQRNNFYLLTYELRNRINEWFFW
jgi:multidrug efflux pump subunit AcrA (membrane-fusion protein)